MQSPVSPSLAVAPPEAGTRPRPSWQPATVVEILAEAPDAVTLRLRLAQPSGFIAGQYYNVRLPLPGRPRPVQRAYSVGSSPLPDPSVIDLGIRETPGGLVSPKLVREFSPGDTLEVRGPYGRFVWDEAAAGPALLVGAGSGLVPLMSMIRFAAQCGRSEPVMLVSSAIDYAHAFYAEELAAAAETHGWLSVALCITRDPHEPRATYHRRIDREILAEVTAGNPPGRAYLCGPPAMVETATAALVSLGLAPEHILTEKYD